MSLQGRKVLNARSLQEFAVARASTDSSPAASSPPHLVNDDDHWEARINRGRAQLRASIWHSSFVSQSQLLNLKVYIPPGNPLACAGQRLASARLFRHQRRRSGDH
jgi:hypothetical protein